MQMRRNLAGAICAAIGFAALAQAEPITSSPKKSSQRKRPPGFPNGLSCLTAASHYKRAISGRRFRGPISRLILIGSRC
jgi:hypothetical protein